MPKLEKTLAMRVLDAQGIPYDVISFPDSVHDAEAVARYAGVPPDNVYKTLVVESVDTDEKPLLVLVAANARLDLKKVGKAVGAKKIQMARHADAERLTGLQVGGISPLALLNRGFRVYIDEWVQVLDFILVSAGQRGKNLRLDPGDLIAVTGAKIIDASKSS